MKKFNYLSSILLLLVLLLSSRISYAVLPGTYTVGGTSPDFPTLKDAVSAINATGIQGGPVTFNIRTGTYSGSNWRGQLNAIPNINSSSRVTFQAESGNPADVLIDVAGASGTNYILRFADASFITIRNLSFRNTNTTNGRTLDFAGSSSNDSVINCRFTGATSTSTTTTGEMAIIYASQHAGADIVFYQNVLNQGNNSVYWYGTNTSNYSVRPAFLENTFNGNATGSSSGMFRTYYTSTMKVARNTFNYVAPSGATFYGLYMLYNELDVDIDQNIINVSGGTTTMYGMYMGYSNYVSTGSNNTSNGIYPLFRRNILNISGTSTTYALYNLYGSWMRFYDNEVNCTVTTGTAHINGPNYYGREACVYNNKFNFTATGSGAVTLSSLVYAGGSQWNDTFRDNIVTATSTSGTIDYASVNYGSAHCFNNDVTLTSTSGIIYNRFQYPSGAYVYNNKIKLNSTTGTCYGLYLLNSTSYSGGRYFNNEISVTSSGAATHYGIYGTQINGQKVYNNVIVSKTTGASYNAYFTGTQYASGSIANNVIHCASASLTATQYGLYNSSTSGEFAFNNNIVSRANGPVTGGYAVYNTGSSLKSDYNLYDLPWTTMFYHTSYNGQSLNSFRAASNTDMNSLVYAAPYTNAAANDFTINAGSPGAWAVNGRGIHDSTRYTDYSGVAVPRFVTDGVPDIGAYEVTPVSIPPDAVATPATPVANDWQVFTFAQDTVLAINWGTTVPATYTVKQYTGQKATGVPAGLKRMFFHVQGTPASLSHTYTAYTFYKNPWIGDIPKEEDAVMARKSGTGGWVGYNYTNAVRETNRNILSTVGTIDSIGSFTAVEDGKIGIRCVYPPTGLKISNITAFSADLSWDAIFNPAGYQVLVKTTPTPPTPAQWAASPFPSTNNITSAGLSEKTKYYVFLRNVCGDKDTSDYIIDSFETIITCHAPTVTSVDINYTRAVVYWAAVETANGYEQALTKSATPPLSGGTNVSQRQILYSNLDEGTTYYAHVRAKCNTIYTTSDWTTIELRTWGVSVKDVTNAGSGIEVYPNPAQDVINVTLGGTVNSGSISVLDVTGKALLLHEVTDNTVIVNVSALPAGVYVVQYATDGRREQVKFTRQ